MQLFGPAHATGAGFWINGVGSFEKRSSGPRFPHLMRPRIERR